MPMPILNDQAEQIDRLARLNLSPEMIKKLSRELTVVVSCQQAPANTAERDEEFFHAPRVIG